MGNWEVGRTLQGHFTSEYLFRTMDFRTTPQKHNKQIMNVSEAVSLP